MRSWSFTRQLTFLASRDIREISGICLRDAQKEKRHSHLWNKLKRTIGKIHDLSRKGFRLVMAWSLPRRCIKGGDVMKYKILFSISILSGALVAFSAGSTSAQTTPESKKDHTEMKESQQERTGEEKTEARGSQEPDRMESKKRTEKERKKGEEEMEARGAQKPGRMGKTGAEGTEAKDRPDESWTKEDVRKAQEALKNKGHDPGSIDGVIGPQTRQAIRAFQNASGLKETGSLDSETAKKLGMERGTASETSSEPGTSAKEAAGTDKGQTSPTTQKEPSLPTGR
jgi:murein L,D-transpeptidase YcbB/YkuD